MEHIDIAMWSVVIGIAILAAGFSALLNGKSKVAKKAAEKKQS